MINKKKSSDDSRSIADLSCGECAVICKVTSKTLSPDSPCVRLMEIGFTPGQEVRMIAKSPFSDPLAVSIRGTVIALRKQEAECILV